MLCHASILRCVLGVRVPRRLGCVVNERMKKGLKSLGIGELCAHGSQMHPPAVEKP